MLIRLCTVLTTCVISLSISSCTSDGAKEKGRVNTANANTVANVPLSAATNLTPADIAKLKWIEGTWRGMDGDTPFYERYKIEETAMVVEGLKEDGSPDGEPSRFELKNGEFGKDEGDKRSVASAISDNHVQFIPAVAGKGNNFRFERQSDGTWIAVLEWPASAEPARQKIYKLERWQPKK